MIGAPPKPPTASNRRRLDARRNSASRDFETNGSSTLFIAAENAASSRACADRRARLFLA
jgi:hypothetical protein